MGEGSELGSLSEKERILIASTLPDLATRIIKHNEAFAVCDTLGDIISMGQSSHGIYYDSMRHVSRSQFIMREHRPFLLGSSVVRDNSLLAIDLTNPDILAPEKEYSLPKGSLHILRTKFFRENTCYEKIVFSNHSLDRAILPISFLFEFDYADIFQIRGTPRKARKMPETPQYGHGTILSRYVGLDDVTRTTHVRFFPAPDLFEDGAIYLLDLKPREEKTIEITTTCFSSDSQSIFFHPNCPAHVKTLTYEKAFQDRNESLRNFTSGSCKVTSSNAQFNEWLERSASDLTMMLSETRLGPYPFAGLPWYHTVFGRDGIITALQTLWWDPRIAKSVLTFLSRTQAELVDESRDAEPGKILHELRSGEMVNIGEVPFKMYYGTADATPLFIILSGKYFQRTGDREFLQSIWPNVQAALRWIDEYGDVDQDGFVEYQTHTKDGLTNQGWKDSGDAIFHEDGSLPKGPIALCELQAYVYQAKLQAAYLAEELELPDERDRLLAESEVLKKKFDEAFWCDELSAYGLALDGEKKLCRVLSSNAGHALYGGIVDGERAQRLAKRLLQPDMFSGWGIRTISENANRYNPMSYHNGSIWPHDNSLIAEGLSQYGRKDLTEKIFTSFFDVSRNFELNRIPELFCGFRRRNKSGPTLYPVACSPQSWASATIFLLLKAMLGLNVKATERKVHFDYPTLPDFLSELRIQDLDVGGAKIDLLLRRHNDDVGINILKKTGDVEIVITK